MYVFPFPFASWIVTLHKSRTVLMAACNKKIHKCRNKAGGGKSILNNENGIIMTTKLEQSGQSQKVLSLLH